MNNLYKITVKDKTHLLFRESEHVFRIFSQVKEKPYGDYFLLRQISNDFIEKKVKNIKGKEDKEETFELKRVKLEESEFISPFEGITDPKEKKRICLELIDKLESKYIGSGAFGNVYLYKPGVVVKIERCLDIDSEDEEEGPFNEEDLEKSFKFVMRREKKVLETLEPVISEGIHPKVYEISLCEELNMCFTFMEEVKGVTLGEILDGLSKDPILMRGGNIPQTIKEKMIGLEIKVCNTIKRFHEIMTENGHENVGHGDLNTGNIMITYGDQGYYTFKLANFDPNNESQKVVLVDILFSKAFGSGFDDDWENVFENFLGFINIFGISVDEQEEIEEMYRDDDD